MLRKVQLIIGAIPRKAGLALGALGGSILYHLGVYRRIVRINLEYVGVWDAVQMKRITRELYRNTGRYAVDFLRPATPLPPHRIHHFDTIATVLKRGRGMIAILGHLGNWEVLATVFGKKLGCLNVVAKRMNNPVIDRWLLKKRTTSHVTTIYTDQALRKMVTVLRKNGIIAILLDQYLRSHGTPAPFLGKEAKTVRTVAGIVNKTGCGVIGTSAIMQSDGSYEIITIPVDDPDVSGMSEDEALTAIQTRHNDFLSEQILAHPEHWFGWFHRRFREYIAYSR